MFRQLHELAQLELEFILWLEHQGHCACERCRYPFPDRAPSRGTPTVREIRDAAIASLDWVVLEMREDFWRSREVVIL